MQSVEDLRVDTVDGRARHVAKEVSGEELRQGRHVLSVQRVHEARDALLRELAQAQLSADVSLLRRVGQHLPDQLEQVGRPRHHRQPLRHGHLEREKGKGWGLEGKQRQLLCNFWINCNGPSTVQYQGRTSCLFLGF